MGAAIKTTAVEQSPTITDTATASDAPNPICPKTRIANSSRTPHPLILIGKLAPKETTAAAAKRISGDT